MKDINISKDGLCQCDQATPCLIGRVGSQPRCSVDDWRNHIKNLEQENKELREAIEVALGQSKDTTLRSSLIVMLMAETLTEALKK